MNKSLIIIPGLIPEYGGVFVSEQNPPPPFWRMKDGREYERSNRFQKGWGGDTEILAYFYDPIKRSPQMPDKFEVFSFKTSIENGEKNVWLCFENGMINLNTLVGKLNGIVAMNLHKAIVNYLKGEVKNG